MQNEKKYIDAILLKQNMAEVYDCINPHDAYNRAVRAGIGITKNIIDKQPAADVAEVRHDE